MRFFTIDINGEYTSHAVDLSDLQNRITPIKNSAVVKALQHTLSTLQSFAIQSSTQTFDIDDYASFTDLVEMLTETLNVIEARDTPMTEIISGLTGLVWTTDVVECEHDL